MAEQIFSDALSSELDKGGAGGFFSPQEGTSTVRVVSPFAEGYRYNYENRDEAKEAGYPVFRITDEFALDNRDKMRLSVQCVVWHYEDGELKSWDISQKNIIKAIRGYFENPKFGNPQKYDLIITRKGKGTDTEYQVQANPPEEIGDDIKEALSEVTIDITKVFDGESPISK